MSKPAKSKQLCSGCHNNFYNGNNDIGVSGCWSFKSAAVVKRYKIGWWTQPTQSGAFKKVWALNCHHAPGQYALYDQLPDFVTTENVR